MEFKIYVFRDVLIYLQDNLSYDDSIFSTKIRVKDYSLDDIAYHVELLIEANYIRTIGDFYWEGNYKEYRIERLTMEGHEFISSIKNDTVWKKIESTAGVIGIEVIKSTIPLLLAYAKSQLGLP